MAADPDAPLEDIIRAAECQRERADGQHVPYDCRFCRAQVRTVNSVSSSFPTILAFAAMHSANSHRQEAGVDDNSLCTELSVFLSAYGRRMTAFVPEERSGNNDDRMANTACWPKKQWINVVLHCEQSR